MDSDIRTLNHPTFHPEYLGVEKIGSVELPVHLTGAL
jgi:hypothetical protein